MNRYQWMVVGMMTLMAVAAGFPVCANDDIAVRRVETVEVPTIPADVLDWTILFYCNADFAGTNPSDTFTRTIQSRDNINILMLEDPHEAEASVWYIEGSADSPVLSCIDTWGEVDMGDDETLTRFLQFAQTWYPAHRTMVMLYSHGYSWKGTCYDDHPSEDGSVETTWLTPEEISTALSAVGGVNALLFTAPCIMGALEVAYEVRNDTELYVASEAVSSLAVWIEALPLLLDTLRGDPQVSMETLGQNLPGWIKETYDRGYWLRQCPRDEHYLIPTAVMSSVNLGASLTALAVALDDYSLALIDALKVCPDQIQQARAESQSFAGNVLVDMFDLALNCAGISEVAVEANNLREALSNATICSVTDRESHPKARGLSLYFPISPNPMTSQQEYYDQYGFGFYGEDYRTAGLDLLADTHWDEFLVAFYEALLD